MRFRFFRPTLFAVLACAALAEPVIEKAGKGDDVDFKYDDVTDFSGITWAGDDDFYVVSNRAEAIFPLRLGIDRETGAIGKVKVGGRIRVKTELSDFEGIAWQPDRRRLYISTEKPAGIVGFDEAGDARFAVEVPRVFAAMRHNKGLESLSFGAGHFWTANEDTLNGDGELSGRTEGGLVRIQKFDEAFRPVAQFAYRTDKSLLTPGTGLTDLCALPDGRLLALERVVGAGLSAKIYLVDFTDATDVSEVRRLKGAEFKPAGKKLLFERHTGGGNFEGIALGPELAESWRSLVLISDSGGGDKHRLIPLRIKLDAAAER